MSINDLWYIENIILSYMEKYYARLQRKFDGKHPKYINDRNNR